MKRIILCILSISLLFCGCAPVVNNEKATHVDALYVKSVWLSYYELGEITSSCDTEMSFLKKLKAHLKKSKHSG